MSTVRFEALREMERREALKIEFPEEKISSWFGCDVFGREQMRQYLPKAVFESVVLAIEENRRIDRRVADQVAAGMKAWAMDHGATHYTHWFQPLNDSTAEKHDTFFEPMWGGGAMENFSGDLLVQQEPDASSFPTGGLRNTFEARGYSAWDPSSPTFLIDDTLCIPSVFISYTGAALDFKTPLLRSMAVLDAAAVPVSQLFDKEVTKVVPTLGWEQEYFLVDEALYKARPDLAQTGRTLMGHSAAKDQQLEDHYWGEIPERVVAFMKDVEMRCFRLGIPLKTRHNETAPNQYECAPMFEEANIAVDHNTLLMTVMRRTAVKHKMQVLFHEKPFQGVNGSGKHINWSLATSTGQNLFAPGKTPKGNMQFLAFFVCALKAAAEHGNMIMASVATAGNSHRLGGGEAPPAIFSVFTGQTLNEVLADIEERVGGKRGLSSDEKTGIKLDIGKIPEIMLDNTDRNRTSPFAFTGNRFELRALGASANCAMPLIVLNTAMAEQLRLFAAEVERLTGGGAKKDEAILQVIREFIISSRHIRFEGNGYGTEWHVEAESRGLKAMTSVTAAISEYVEGRNMELFVGMGVFSKDELEARYEIKCETYLKKVQIESRVLGDLAVNHIIPTAIRFQNVLIENVRGVKELFRNDGVSMTHSEMGVIKEISGHVAAIRELVHNMVEARKKWNVVESIPARAEGYEVEVEPFMAQIRTHVDALEMIVDDRLWTLPKYREMFTI
ncbi:MAG: glutamine synthetase III [Alistipes sp.]|jgi:glutamine synthetase|nr:glutamine synthetase III [Alistipes sp.]